MKKSYVTPQFLASGDAVRETLGTGVLTPREFGPSYKPIASAGVGFYL
jgi:hypothetical protein